MVRVLKFGSQLLLKICAVCCKENEISGSTLILIQNNSNRTFIILLLLMFLPLPRHYHFKREGQILLFRAEMKRIYHFSELTIKSLYETHASVISVEMIMLPALFTIFPILFRFYFDLIQKNNLVKFYGLIVSY